MRQAEAKYRAQRCMPFGSCKESGWEKEQRGEGGLEEEDYLFRQPGGDSRVPGTFTFRFKKILQEGDLPDNLNVHSLRHTNASMLIAQGVDVRTVAGLLGHAQPSTTLDIYSHTFDKNKKLAQQKLAEAMGLSRKRKNSPRNSEGCFSFSSIVPSPRPASAVRAFCSCRTCGCRYPASCLAVRAPTGLPQCVHLHPEQ